MVLGFILYETFDILYNVTKLTYYAGKSVYEWYNDTENEDEFINLNNKGDVISTLNVNSFESGDTQQEIYLKEIRKLRDEINFLKEKFETKESVMEEIDLN
tara:strand:+ start:701 stop:1003 length:303 start_codon:yes stop_codon:yes gene_type:complete